MSSIPDAGVASAERRPPRPIDVPPPVSPDVIHAQYPPEFEDDDEAQPLSGLPHSRSRKLRRLRPLPVTPVQIILTVVGGLAFITILLSGSLNRFRFIGLPQHDGPIPQVFRANPNNRFVIQRHNITLPPTLSRYHFASLGSWANGTIHVVPASPREDVRDLTFEVVVEAPSPQVASLVKIDARDAHSHGIVSLKMSGSAPDPSLAAKWIKIRTRLILPRHHKFDKFEMRFLSKAPYWWRQKIEGLEDAGISFNTFSTLSLHGDIEIDSLQATRADITTERGDLTYKRLNVASGSLRLDVPKGIITPVGPGA